MTSRQLAYSHKKVASADIRRRLNMLLVMLCLFGSVAAIDAVTHPENKSSIAVMAGSSMLAGGVTMATIGNMDEVSAKESAGSQIGMRVWLISRDQIDFSKPFPQPNAQREVGNIPLKLGEYMHYQDAVSNSVKSNGTGETGDINVDYTNTLSFVMAGNREKLMDFIEEYAGRGFIVIYQECGSGVRYIMGSVCKPMVLKSFDRKDDNEGRYVTFTFENKYWRQPLIYVGDIIQQDPVTVAAGATNLAVESSNNRYNLSSNTGPTALANVSGIASSDYGRVITIYGSGGSNPTTISDSTTFVLVDGVTWHGNGGSEISFKIHDANTLTEVSRVETA
ncbi:hypothetical protein DMA11_10280 [Marinilabiliaceae bacterium JC017]|nr:hypothetical protein DMA11_10280 [Marinilabiliaceae bacterium JC017]